MRRKDTKRIFKPQRTQRARRKKEEGKRDWVLGDLGIRQEPPLSPP
jgi:hypothetical protein